jgi:hypothetical protein
MRYLRKLALTMLVPTLLVPVACDEQDLDVFSEVKTLRVLGVRADLPYASPGERPNLEMLLHDGAPGALQPDGTARQVRVVWVEGCVNPPGDMYYLCYPALHAVMDHVSDEDLAFSRVPEGVPVGFGLNYRATIPADVISSKPGDPELVYPYGLSYVFFAACAGDLRKLPEADRTGDFPLGCFRTGSSERLGEQDFLYGYFPIYAFETLRNANPEVAGVLFGPGATGAPCTDSGTCAAGEVCSKAGYCIATVPRCVQEDEEDCPGIQFKPVVEASTLERATMAKVSEQDAPLENTWVMYHSTAGSWKAGSRMIHDPDMGFQSDYEGYWRAPRTGDREVRVWAVVRDNRGGVSWVHRDVWVE